MAGRNVHIYIAILSTEDCAIYHRMVLVLSKAQLCYETEPVT